MVVADFLHLTDAEYASRIKSYPDSQLLQQIQVKHMQIKVGSAINETGVILSLGGKVLGHVLKDNVVVPVVLSAIPTLGKRRVVLSTQKIRLLEEELARRGLGKSEFAEVVEKPPAYE
jgi:hypothetical protein